MVFVLKVIDDPKIIINMANIKTIYLSSERSGIDYELIAYVNSFNEIYISIQNEDYSPAYVCLDRSTAIRLVKDLKRQISLIEEEVDNG